MHVLSHVLIPEFESPARASRNLLAQQLNCILHLKQSTKIASKEIGTELETKTNGNAPTPRREKHSHCCALVHLKIYSQKKALRAMYSSKRDIAKLVLRNVGMSTGCTGWAGQRLHHWFSRLVGNGKCVW